MRILFFLQKRRIRIIQSEDILIKLILAAVKATKTAVTEIHI